MIRHSWGESVTVTRQGEPTGTYDDDTGAAIIGPDSTFPIDDVAVEPAGTSEDPQSMGLWVVKGFTLYLPYGAVLRPTDRLTVRGVEGWQVVGDTTASGWRNPFTGSEKGSVVSVKKAG
jgi:hypothetical protein